MNFKQRNDQEKKKKKPNKFRVIVGFHPETKNLHRKGEVTWRNSGGRGWGGQAGRERNTYVHADMCACMYVKRVPGAGVKIRLVLCCAILESNGTVPADPADSAVPSAVPEVKPSSSIRRHFSGNTDLTARETVSLLLCSPYLASCIHLSSDVITVNYSPQRVPIADKMLYKCWTKSSA